MILCRGTRLWTLLFPSLLPFNADIKKGRGMAEERRACLMDLQHTHTSTNAALGAAPADYCVYRYS